MRRQLAWVIGLAVVLAVPGAASGGTYKVLTYNVQALPPIAEGESAYGRPNTERGADIARRVVQGRYDVVAFNEVFAESMRDTLLGSLPPAQFRTRVEKLSTATPGHEDSGLMLFSRFKALPIPNPADEPFRKECVTPGAGGCLIAFHTFQACSNAGQGFPGDCQSDKGVGLVRLKNTATGRPLDVLFTHMNASYGPEGSPAFEETRAARAQQLVEIRLFMERWLPKKSAKGRDAIFMGDLNVISGNSEWRAELGAGGNLNKQLGFRDIWRYEHPKPDPGYTVDPRNSQQGDATREKLDYILLRRASAKQTCVHHQHIPFGLFRDITLADLSDHWPVDATIGARLTGNCSPHRARTISKPTALKFSPPEPGGSRWYRLTTPGTWSVLSSAKGSWVTGYADTDLSTPLDALGPPGHSRRTTVHVTNRPVYIRVYAQSLKGLPKGKLSFLKHDGTTTVKAVHLPHARRAVTSFGFDLQNPDNPANASEQYWRIRTRPLTSGDRQTVRIAASGYGGDTTRLRIRILDLKRKAIASSGKHRHAPVLTTQLPAKAGDYLVELSRVAGDVGNVELRYTTNLRSARLLRLKCNLQEDETGDDDIRIRIASDGKAVKEFYLGAFDDGQPRSLQTSYGTGTLVNYIDRIEVGLTEIDNDPNDDLGTRVITDHPKSVFLTKFTGDGSDYDLFVESVPLP